MTFRKYLILLAVVIFGSCGDVCLARGMRDFGAVTSGNWTRLLLALVNPWVLGGIACSSSFSAAISPRCLGPISPTSYPPRHSAMC